MYCIPNEWAKLVRLFSLSADRAGKKKEEVWTVNGIADLAVVAVVVRVAVSRALMHRVDRKQRRRQQAPLDMAAELLSALRISLRWVHCSGTQVKVAIRTVHLCSLARALDASASIRSVSR